MIGRDLESPGRRRGSAGLGQSGLLEHGVGIVAGKNLGIDNETPLGQGAVPDLVIALALALEAASASLEDAFELWREVAARYPAFCGDAVDATDQELVADIADAVQGREFRDHLLELAGKGLDGLGLRSQAGEQRGEGGRWRFASMARGVERRRGSRLRLLAAAVAAGIRLPRSTAPTGRCITKAYRGNIRAGTPDLDRLVEARTSETSDNSP
jgi:hypothetical protein